MNNRSFVMSLILGILLSGPENSAEAGSTLLKIKLPERSFIGRELTHSEQQCWVLERDGRLVQFEFEKVVGFQKMSERYRAFSPSEMRFQLLKEFGKAFEVTGTSHYLICGPQGKTRQYGEHLEQLYQETSRYFSTRGVLIQAPEYPLIAIVFPEREQFVNYAKKDQISNTSQLGGYYHLLSNRITFYDPGERAETKGIPSNRISVVRTHSADRKLFQETLAHEATHQLAFNFGIHSRISDSPRWIVEGLALVFEHPDSRSGRGVSTSKQRINLQRYLHFRNYLRQKRPSEGLKSFLTSDRIFKTNPLDAYSEAWALSFFLSETRAEQYVKYLRKIAKQPPFEKYTSEQRLDDFCTAFKQSKDLQMFEAEYLRFIKRLQ